MALETATYINGLVSTNPLGTDTKAQGDDHIRLLKSTIKATFPLITTPWNATAVTGTVSQSAGVPTGAIIERGSNANGDYVKFADGTMICVKISLANQNVAPGQAVFDATFAASFAGDYVLNGVCLFYVGAGQTGNRLYGSTFSLNTASNYYMNTGQSPDLVNPSFTLGALTALSYRMMQVAVGKWY